ncbi:MAG: sulfatase-like hydrolase/transferase, partial [bacterium]|nr:sulfatase-like hydrolase/transferase [bacterium]
MNRSLTRRACLKQLGLGAAAAAWGPSLAQAQDPPRPNIIYIMTDDHAAHALSCYGSVVNRTPNLDRLAREGVRFTHSFCTNSLCAPCRAVVLTGKFNHVNGLTDNRQTFDGSQTTFPKLLQKAGYETAMIGKWHLKTDPTGFDYWNILPGQGLYYNPVFIEMGERKTYTGYCTDITTDLALNWLEQRDENKPFLLMYHHKAPHRPWDPPLKNLHHYEDAPLSEPATLFDDNQGRGKAAQEQDMTIAKTLTKRDLKFQGPDNLTPEQQQAWDAAYGPKNEAFQKANLQGDDLIRWKYQRYMKDYLRCIDSVDENVGRLLAYLDANGLAENTIVVYTSDQGFFLGDHGWFDKRFMYEESLRMP